MTFMVLTEQIWCPDQLGQDDLISPMEQYMPNYIMLAYCHIHLDNWVKTMPNKAMPVFSFDLLIDSVNIRNAG